MFERSIYPLYELELSKNGQSKLDRRPQLKHSHYKTVNNLYQDEDSIHIDLHKLRMKELTLPSIVRKTTYSCFNNTSNLCKLYLTGSLTMTRTLRSTFRMPPSIYVKGHSLNLLEHGGPSSIANATSYAS
mgnify:CR=1 FL=1